MRVYHIVYRWGDKLEDKVRKWCSHSPIFYAFLGALGVVILWRGIWHSMDMIMEKLFVPAALQSPGPWWDGPLSTVLGTVLMLATGLFVSNFIGNEIIISGLRGQKKLAEKTEDEILSEVETIEEIHNDVHTIAKQVQHIEKTVATDDTSTDHQDRVKNFPV